MGWSCIGWAILGGATVAALFELTVLAMAWRRHDAEIARIRRDIDRTRRQ